MGKELVHIWMVTYNHVRYITQAIESVLMQKTHFRYKLIIGEDCSTDGTREIVKKYADKHNDKIKAILNAKNIGAKANAIQVYTACTAKYIALLEGDDYWTDPLKLQKQVEFLENNKEYSLCALRFKTHDISNNKFYDDSYSKLFSKSTIGYDIDINIFLKLYLTKTLTVIFRRELLDIEDLKNYKYLRDSHIIFHLLLRNKGYLMNFFGGVYTIHQDSFWSSKNDIDKIRDAYNIYKELYNKNPTIETLKKKYIATTESYLNQLIKTSKWPFLDKAILSTMIEFLRISKSLKKFLSKIYFMIK